MCRDDVNSRSLLDRAALYVRVHGTDRPNDGSHNCVLFHLENITGFFKLRGLVHIFNADPDCGHVFIVQTQKAGVRMRVLHLDLKRVRLFLLIVKRLRYKRNNEQPTNKHTKLLEKIVGNGLPSLQ